MQAQGLEWGADYRALGRQVIGNVLRGQMDQAIDAHLDRMAVLDQADRRNGYLIRRGLTGDSLQMICVDGGAGLLAALPTSITKTKTRASAPLSS